VVDDYVNDSTPCYKYTMRNGKYLEVDEEAVFYLHNGDSIIPFDTDFQKKGLLSSDIHYVLFKKDGQKYAVNYEFIYYKSENAKDIESQKIIGKKMNLRHEGIKRFFLTMTPYYLIAACFLSLWVILWICSKMQRIQPNIVIIAGPILILAGTAIEVMAMWHLGLDAFWWCEQKYYGFLGALLRLIPIGIVLVFQISSIFIFEAAVLQGKSGANLSIKPTLYGMLGVIPAFILALVITQVCGIHGKTDDYIMEGAVLLSLIGGFAYSWYRNNRLLGMPVSLLMTLFIAVYLIGCLIVAFSLIILVFQLLIQVLIVLVIFGALLFGGKSAPTFGGGGSSSSSSSSEAKIRRENMLRDKKGNWHPSIFERDVANKKINEERAN